MVASFNEAFDKKEMSPSQKQAIITLVEKKGKDRSYLENWRPISLITVDAKIASKVIATRIITVSCLCWHELIFSLVIFVCGNTE